MNMTSLDRQGQVSHLHQLKTRKFQIEIEECSSVKQCAIFVSILSDAKYEDIYRNIQMAPEVRTWNFT